MRSRRMVKVEVDSGDRIETGAKKEKLGFEEDKETATDMVCIKFVILKLAEHFWALANPSLSSFTSTFTSLSMVRDRKVMKKMKKEDGLVLF